MVAVWVSSLDVSYSLSTRFLDNNVNLTTS